MTENNKNEAGLRELTARLRALDDAIPVPESVKASQLLARLEQAEQPVVRVLRTDWRRYASIAAAFMLLAGGLWMYSRVHGGGVGIAPMAAPEAEQSASAVAADVNKSEPVAAIGAHIAEAEGADDAENGAVMLFEEEVVAEENFAGDYTQVRQRLARLQEEDAYYVAASDHAVAEQSANTGSAMANDIGGLGGPSVRGYAAAAPRMAKNATVNSDVVRVDGNSLYYLQVPVGEKKAEIKVLDMKSMSLTSTITLANADTVADILVEDGMLAVLYSDENFYTLPLYERQLDRDPVRSGVATISATVLEVFDMANIAAPVSVRKLEQQGDYIYANVENGQVYLVTDCGLSTNARNKSAQDAELVPAVRDSAVSLEVTAVPAGGICLPEGATVDRYAVVSAVSLKNAKAPAQTKAILGGASAAHQGEGALYVAGGFEASGTVAEPMGGMRTGLIKFKLEGALALVAQGSVRGGVWSNDAMNAVNDGLRVVSSGNGETAVSILNGALVETGTVENPFTEGTETNFVGGRLYAAGEHGLIAINPATSRVTSEAAGTSSGQIVCLYQVSDVQLLALGYDAANALQITLYDISGEVPQRIGATTLGASGSYSPALERGGELVLADGTLVLPVQLYNEAGELFNGAVALSIKDGTLEELGRVTTTAGKGSDNIYAEGLDARYCIAISGKFVLLSRAEGSAYNVPALEQSGLVKL